jgi:predicted AAA+ superfamily ATPase
MKSKYKRPQFETLTKRLREPRRFIQIVFGPRQVGKTTLVELLSTAGLLTGLQKFTANEIRTRGSSPKFQVFNTALIAAFSPEPFKDIRKTPDRWGHLFESAVGAHLANQAFEDGLKLTYWRDGNYEVDFVLSREDRHIGIEVKSGRKWDSLAGMTRFIKQFNPHRTLLIGTGGIPIQEFFETPADVLFQ